jgi:DNA invertase Pin-like site-specific DNA recombinase
MLNLIGSIAQLERELMLERQCEGIHKRFHAAEPRCQTPLVPGFLS